MKRRMIVVRSTGFLPVDEYWRRRAVKVKALPVGWVSIGDFVLGLGYYDEPEFFDIVEAVWRYVNRQRRVKWVKCIDLGDGIYSFAVKRSVLEEKLYFASPGGRDERIDERTEKAGIPQRLSGSLRI